MKAPAERIAVIVHQLRALAQEGLHWSGENVHDERRYRGVLRAAAELAALDGAIDPDDLALDFVRTPVSQTPYVGSEGAVFDDTGRLLLIRREDDGLWAMPGGAGDVGETAAETAVREVFEETGVRVSPVGFIGIYDSRLVGSAVSVHLYHLVFLCRPARGQTPIAGPETTDVGWFGEGEVPDLSPGHPPRVADAFAMWRGERSTTYYDGEPLGKT